MATREEKAAWLTNLHRDQRAQVDRELRPGNPTLFFGDPRATEKYSVEALQRMGLIGAYRK